MLRPARRSVLLSSALLVPLGLAGCDPEKQEPPEETAAPTLTLEPMTTDEALLPEEPLRDGSWNLSPTADRPLAVLVSRVRAQQRDLFAVTLEHPGGLEVPIDPVTTALAVDRHGSTAAVLAASVVEAQHRQVLWSSTDLTTWKDVEVTGIDGEIGAFGGGIVVSRVLAGSIAVWQLAEDGTATALTAVTVPEDAGWSVVDVARNGARVVLVVNTMDADGVPVPTVVTSQDTGASWGEPEILPVDGSTPWVTGICPLGEGFLVDGGHRPASGDGYGRPMAWVSANGTGFAPEEIPLPTFGLDGWSRGERKLSADDPIDWLEFDSSPAVVDASSGTAHLALFAVDDCRCATRSAKGTWTTSELGDFAERSLESAAAVPSAQILLGQDRVLTRAGGEGKRDLGLPYGGWRNYVRLRHEVVEGTDSVIQGYQSIVEEGSAHVTDDIYANVLVSIRDDALVLSEDAPEEVEGWEWAIAAHPREGVEIFDGRTTDEEGTAQHVAMVRVDGAWVEPEGFEVPGMYASGGIVALEDRLYMTAAGSTEEEDEETLSGIVVLSSADGLTWERVGSGPEPVGEDSPFAGGAYMGSVTSVDGVLIGLGATMPGEGPDRAVTFVLEDDVWIPRIVEDIPSGMTLSSAHPLGNQVRVVAEGRERFYHGVLAADGTCTRAWMSSDQERRDAPLELGDGALLAGGWSRTSTAYGVCVWASRDNGETWTATVLPGHEGRFPKFVSLARDGEDIVVIAAHDDAPVGFRIIGAKAAVGSGA